MTTWVGVICLDYIEMSLHLNKNLGRFQHAPDSKYKSLSIILSFILIFFLQTKDKRHSVIR